MNNSNEALRVSGKRFPLPRADARWKLELRPGGWLIAEAPDGTRHRLSYWEARGRVGASIGGRLIQGELLVERRQGRGAGGGGEESDLVAQFPGKVRKLLVQAGVRVGAGDALILVEAMKMEFSVKAPVAGVVQRILVQEGQQIAPGDRFLEMAVEAEASRSVEGKADETDRGGNDG